MQNKESGSLYIDCVAMKHKIQEQLWQELKPTSTKDYFKKLREKMAKSPLWLAAKSSK